MKEKLPIFAAIVLLTTILCGGILWASGVSNTGEPLATSEPAPEGKSFRDVDDSDEVPERTQSDNIDRSAAVEEISLIAVGGYDGTATAPDCSMT